MKSLQLRGDAVEWKGCGSGNADGQREGEGLERNSMMGGECELQR